MSVFAGTAGDDTGLNPIDVWGLRADGTVVRLTDTPERSLDPVMFPAGGELLFARGPDDEEAGRPSPATQLWRLSFPSESVEPVRASEGAVFDPAISPDATMYAFSGDADDPETGARRIKVASLDGQGQRTLTPAAPGEATVEEHPAWAPDGRSIAYTYQYANDSGDGFFAIRATDVQSGATRTLFEADPNVLLGSVAWSLDGKWILFTQAVLASPERLSISAWEMSTATLEPRRVADGTVFELVYSSPDGSTFSGVGKRDEEGWAAMWTWSRSGGTPARQEISFSGMAVHVDGPLSIAACALKGVTE